MTNFCPRCGKPLVPGKPCTCTQANNKIGIDLDKIKEFFEKTKNRMGIGDPERNQGDAFEKGKDIVPYCVNSNEGEIPVKQYEVATLRNRILGIPYTKAIGRVQVTNKRVVFRAPGRSLAGRTTLQHEFAIDELAGMEARREYIFNFWDLLIGLFLTLLSGSIISGIITGVLSDVDRDTRVILTGILSLLVGAAGCVPFWMLKKRWLIKLMCLGGSLMTLFTGSTILSSSASRDDTFASFCSGFFVFLSLIVLVFTVFTLCVHAIKPNLVLIVKTKSASGAIDISRKKSSLFGRNQEEHTGYSEVIPLDNAERCIREMNAMITDIQKLGDFGIGKWKA